MKHAKRVIYALLIVYISALLYGEAKNYFKICPEGTAKVRLFDGGVACSSVIYPREGF